MSVRALNWCKYQTCLSPSSKLVLFVLANYCDELDTCYPSEGHLAEICGLSTRQIRRCVTGLKESGLITVRARKGISNLYTLNMGKDTSVPSTRDTRDLSSRDTYVQKPRTPMSSNTKHIQNKKRSLNELAG